MECKAIREESSHLHLEDHKHFYLLSASMYKSLSEKKKARGSHDLKGILKKLIEAVGLCEQIMDNKNEDGSLMADIESCGCCCKASRYQRREVMSSYGVVDTRDSTKESFDSKGNWNRHPRLPSYQRRKHESPACSEASTTHATENVQLDSRYHSALRLPDEISTDENGFIADLCSDEEYALSSQYEADSSEYDADNEDTWERPNLVQRRWERGGTEVVRDKYGFSSDKKSCIALDSKAGGNENRTRNNNTDNFRNWIESSQRRGEGAIMRKGNPEREELADQEACHKGEGCVRRLGLMIKGRVTRQQATEMGHKLGTEFLGGRDKTIGEVLDGSSHGKRNNKIDAERVLMIKDDFYKQQSIRKGHRRGKEIIRDMGKCTEFDRSNLENHYTRLDAERHFLIKDYFTRQKAVGKGYERGEGSIRDRGRYIDFDESNHDNRYSWVDAERCFMMKGNFPRQHTMGKGLRSGKENIVDGGKYTDNDESYCDNHYRGIYAEHELLIKDNFPRQQTIGKEMERRKESFGNRGNRVDFDRNQIYSHYRRVHTDSGNRSISDYDADTENEFQRSVIKKFPFIERTTDKKVYAIENSSKSLRTWDADETMFVDSRLLHVLRWRIALKRAFKAIDNVLAKLEHVGKRDSKPAVMLLGMRAETLEKLKLSEETVEVFESSGIEEDNNLERYLHL